MKRRPAREEVDPDANIILGATFDEELEGIIRVLRGRNSWHRSERKCGDARPFELKPVSRPVSRPAASISAAAPAPAPVSIPMPAAAPAPVMREPAPVVEPWSRIGRSGRRNDLCCRTEMERELEIAVARLMMADLAQSQAPNSARPPSCLRLRLLKRLRVRLRSQPRSASRFRTSRRWQRLLKPRRCSRYSRFGPSLR